MQEANTQELTPEAPADTLADTLASNYINGNTRQEGELYCDYRARLYWENRLMKQYLHGRTMWSGKGRTIVNIERKVRTNKKARKSEKRQEIRSEQGKLAPKDVKCMNKKAKKRFMEACSK